MVLLAGLVACREPERLGVSLGVDDLVIATRVDARGEVLEARLTRGGVGLSLELGDDERLFTFVLSPEELIGADGRAVPDEVLEALQAVPAEKAAILGCGRCLAPSPTAPLVLIAGSVCAPPAFARARGFLREGGELSEIDDPDVLESARAGARLIVPGDCACEPPPSSPPTRAQVCPVLPAEAPFQGNHRLLFPEGRVVSVGAGGALDYRPGEGPPVVYPFTPPLGRLRAIGRLPGTGDVLIASEEATRFRDRPRLHRLSPGGRLEVIDGAPPIRTEVIGALEPDGSFYIGGQYIPDAMAASVSLHRCVFPPAGLLSCRKEELVIQAECIPAGDGFIVAVANLDGGASVALSDRGYIFVRPVGSERWYCAPQPASQGLGFEGRLFVAAELTTAAVRGDRLYFCGTFLTGPDEFSTALASVEISLEDQLAVGPPALEIAPHLAAVDLPSTCSSMAALPGGGLRAALQLGDGALDLDGAGNVVAEHTSIGRAPARSERPLYPELSEPVIELATSTSGATLAAGSGGALYLERSPGAAFQRFYGATLPELGGSRALTWSDPVGQRTLVFGANGVVELGIDGGGSCAVSTTPLQVAGFPRPAGTRIEAAVRDRRAPAVVLLAEREGRRSRILTVDLAAQSITGTLEGEPLDDRAWTSAVELAPGLFVFTSRDGPAVVVGDDGVRELALPRDDPATEIMEPERDEELYAIAGGHGVAWIAGYDTVARVQVTHGGPRAEAYWLPRLGGGVISRGERDEPSDLSGIAAWCPDDLLLGANESVRSAALDAERTTVPFWLRHDPEDATGDRLVLAEDPDYDPDVFPGPHPSEDVVGIIRYPDGFGLVFDRGTIHRAGSDDRLVAPFPDLSWVAQGEGFTILGGRTGHVAVMVEQAR